MVRAEKGTPGTITELPPDTGERVLVQDPLHPRDDGQLAHVLRYRFAAALLESLSSGPILDVACGIGYAAVMLNPSRREGRVIGIDIDQRSVNYASRHFGGHGRFVRGSATDLPLSDGSVRALVSLETIEHIAEPVACITEFARVLADDGVVVVSTPEPELSRLINLGDGNPFHLKELTKEEFRSVLQEHFQEISYFGQTQIDPAQWQVKNTSARNRLRGAVKKVDRLGLVRAAYLSARRIPWVDARVDQYKSLDHSVVPDKGESFLKMIAVCHRPRRAAGSARSG